MTRFSRTFCLLVTSVALSTAAVPARAGTVTLTSGLIQATGERVACSLVNAGKKPITEVSVRLLDNYGNEIPYSAVSVASLDPGKAEATLSDLETPIGFVYCQVSYVGSKKAGRALLSRQNGIVSLLSVPLQ